MLDIILRDIDSVRRIGRSEMKRPILISLISYRTKLEVLRNCYKLRGTDISISEDFPVLVRAVRKELIGFKRKAIENKKTRRPAL